MSLPRELAVRGPKPLRGRLRVPGDKSISHRALILAAVSEGRCVLRGLGDGDDIVRTRAALELLGVHLRDRGEGGMIVPGRGFEGLREPSGVLDCGNSGTAVRLLAGLLAGRPFHSVLAGDDSIAKRPMGRVVRPLRQMGARLDGRSGGELAPLSVRGGGLHGIRHQLEVASAQVKTALLLAGLQAEGATEIIEPSPSRDHTERLLETLGVAVERIDGGVSVGPGRVSAFDLDIPGDPSAAAFFVVGACVTPGSDLVVEDLCLNPTRIGFIDVLLRMGARIEVHPRGERGGEPVGDVWVRAGELRATDIWGPEIPTVIDEIPPLAIAAAFARGTTKIRDAAELRVKESDRIGTLEQELTQMGIKVETQEDGLTVHGGEPRAALLKSHGDHRIALAAAVAANAVAGMSTVRGWQAVASSYPSFAEHLLRVTEGG